MMKLLKYVLVAVFVALLSRPAVCKELVDYIDPMIGAQTSGGRSGHGLGKCFPGATTPFGMVQLSPDTTTEGDNGPGYSAHHTTIEGFSFTHMSGIGWFGDLGNFQVMPVTGKRQFDRNRAKSEYSHEAELATAGYYMVDLKRYGIKAEMTAAPRAGMLRFTFPESSSSRIQIDLGRRIGQKSRLMSHSVQEVTLVDDHTIEGYMQCSEKDGGWGHGSGHVNYTQYFTAKFSIPIKKYGVWSIDQNHPDNLALTKKNDRAKEIVFDVQEGKKEHRGNNAGFFLEFATQNSEQVLLKAGVSYVSQDGARANLEHDIPDWDFDALQAKARGLWSDALNAVSIEGGSEEDKTVYATALYHSFIDPRSVSDVNGEYIGADNRVHKADGFVYRSIFSGWDVFRSQFPLLTLIRPDIVNDEVNSLVQLATLSGKNYLPRWELLNSYSKCMIANPAVSVIADAYEKGIRNYNVEEAYRQCSNTVEKMGNRGGYSGGISDTMEYGYHEWCAGRFAESLGKTEDAKKYYNSSLAYRKIWSDEVKWFRARGRDKKDGTKTWKKWTSKTDHDGQGTCESNPYQQGWFVPHDVAGMVELMGKEFFIQELTTFFEKVPEDFMWNDYYNHPNEPCHHVAFLFNYVDLPWLTQKWTRRICDKAYGVGNEGLVGNEDVGQMSAWFILSAMGLHPVNPGDNIYQITSPVFSKISIRLDQNYYKGKRFTVIANNNSADNIYIQSARLNGKPYEKSWITHDEIVKGGTLEFEMGPEPNKEWGVTPDARPYSLSRSQSLGK